MKQGDKKLVKKSVVLVHSSNEISLLARKIATALLFWAFDKLNDEDEYVIPIAKLCSIIGYNSNDHETIKNALRMLMQTLLEWNLLDKETKKEQTWTASTMLASAHIEGPLFFYSYSKRMRILCSRPDVYALLDMGIISIFKSTYSLALYETCARFVGIKKTPWLDLILIRKLMGVTKGKYSLFTDFNKWVVKTAMKEVNNKADFLVKAEYKKTGRAIVALRFLIDKKRRSANCEITPTNETGEKLKQKLTTDFGCTKKQAQQLTLDYTDDYLWEKINLIETSRSYKQGKIQCLYKYLEKALIEDYKESKSSLDVIEDKRDKIEKQKMIEQSHNVKIKNYLDYQNKQIPKVLNSLDKEQKQKIEHEFDQYIRTTLYGNFYEKEGIKNPMVMDLLGDFIRREHKEVTQSLLSFEDFLTS